MQYLTFPIVGIEVLFRYLFALSKSKKYLESPEKFNVDERFRTVYLLVSRILYFKGIKIIEEGWDNVPKRPVLFVPNHKSNIDPLILINILNNHKDYPLVTFVAKKELLDKPFGKILRLIDVVFIDRNDIRQIASSIEDQENLIRNNISLGIFPEGTRTFSDEIKEFKGGSLKVAYRTFVPIVPVVLYNTQQRMDKKNKNYKINKYKGYKVYVRFLEPLMPIKFMNVDSNNVANNIRNSIHENYLKIKLSLEKK
ncbi:lysophospholipid acyltransferase family protein [Mycoplasmoides alvi]|uniref:lysophospholipid acyltransferase family protein n=1 Tax=Mycoplasmoides alvi TaxID=78580 RepID=UPI00146F95FB|nr:lysophospholipid acyltransferase family protein [Mycoplasmoides alvi]